MFGQGFSSPQLSRRGQRRIFLFHTSVSLGTGGVDSGTTTLSRLVWMSETECAVFASAHQIHMHID